MGATAAETLNEIEQTRTRLGVELEELEARLPAAVSVAKRAGAALAGVGALGVLARFALRRRKKTDVDRRYRELEKRLSKLERRVAD
jgi:hypothetical protein